MHEDAPEYAYNSIVQKQIFQEFCEVVDWQVCTFGGIDSFIPTLFNSCLMLLNQHEKIIAKIYTHLRRASLQPQAER